MAAGTPAPLVVVAGAAVVEDDALLELVVVALELVWVPDDEVVWLFEMIGTVLVMLVKVLPAESVVTTANPTMVEPVESVVVTAPLGRLVLMLRLAASVTAAMVLVTLATTLPAESVTGPVTPTMVAPAESVVTTALRVDVMVAPAVSVMTMGAPGIPPELTTPRRTLMADCSEAMLSSYCLGTAVKKPGGVGSARAELMIEVMSPVTPLAEARLWMAD